MKNIPRLVHSSFFGFWLCLISTNSGNVRLGRLRIVFECDPKSEYGRFDKYETPSESAPLNDRRFGSLFGNFLFIYKTPNSKGFCSIAAMIESVRICCQAPDSSSCFSNGNLVFTRMNVKPAVLKNFEFDCERYFRLCESYRFQNLVGVGLSIKHTVNGLNGASDPSQWRFIGSV